MNGTYVSDLRHFLDDDGEIVSNMPVEARQMASFLALIVDEASRRQNHNELKTSLRCRQPDCTGTILAINESGEVNWFCAECEHNGVIRNWQGTKWDHSSTS